MQRSTTAMENEWLKGYWGKYKGYWWWDDSVKQNVKECYYTATHDSCVK
jgi:hypothetical protein